MKKNVIFLAILLLPLWLSAGSSLPKVSLVEGVAFLVNISTGEKKILKTGDTIPVGFAVLTEANSRVLLELSDGTKKLILSKSRFQIMTQKQWEEYKKTSQSANRIFTLIGRKAGNLSKKSLQREEIIREINYSFANQQYLKTIDLIEKNSIQLSLPNEVYIGAVSYLKLGLDETSLKLFLKLIEYDTYEYRDFARFGAFLCLLRLSKPEDAKKMRAQTMKLNVISEEMEDLLN